MAKYGTLRSFIDNIKHAQQAINFLKMCILTTFFLSFPKSSQYTYYPIFYTPPSNSLPYNVQHWYLILQHECQGCLVLAHKKGSIATHIMSEQEQPFFPGGQLFFVKFCLAGGNHIMSGWGEN